MPDHRSRLRRFVPHLALAAIATLMPALAAAQLRIGQTAGFTGAVSAGVGEATTGAKLYIDAVNAQGGVAGQSIELVSKDDKFDPALAAANAEQLAADPRVLALFLSWGTPQTEAMMPTLKKAGLPLVGPATGAMVLHRPVNPYIFNVRATYQREAQNAVRYLGTVGVSRIALLLSDDSFGADASIGAMRGFAEQKLTPAVQLKFDRVKPDIDALVDAVVKSQAQAVLFVGSAQTVADGTKAMRAAGSRAQLVTLSNNASQGFLDKLGPLAHGTVIGQILPSERSVSVPMVKEAIALAKVKGIDNVSPAMMQGFAAAKVLVEGLRHAGKAPTRESLIAALDGMRNFDLGGVNVGYSPTDHTGLDFADLAIVDANGKLRR